MIDQDDVFYMDGAIYIVRMVASNSYVVREYLGLGELGPYQTIRHPLVEFNRTLDFVGTWDNDRSEILWDYLRHSKDFPALPENIRPIFKGKKPPSTRKAHNDRVIQAYELKGKK